MFLQQKCLIFKKYKINNNNNRNKLQHGGSCGGGLLGGHLW